jgi:hypothetical protein
VESDQEREAWIAKMVAELRAYSQVGGEILFGTDIGYTSHFDTSLEFSLMSQAGMSKSLRQSRQDQRRGSGRPQKRLNSRKEVERVRFPCLQYVSAEPLFRNILWNDPVLHILHRD